ncbi:acyltransferase family protein [Cytophaga aurantiaca]|uniref:acyltransferase family protein n=1 Tax=Cytophaga aurantiaca TaxID=29530 RepID=UPI00035DC303|nr:acyltransferase [Cytophaga aurantiaca]
MKTTKLNHIVELDGIRGLAVLLVIIFHFLNQPILSNNSFDHFFKELFAIGWVGVDLFFVLSGFLITRILLNTKSGSNYFISFYYKRTLRIFPLYYLYLILIFFIIYPILFNRVSEFEQSKMLLTEQSQAWFWLYLSNIKQVMDGTFFGGGLGHLWSLSIEEQFYILWPCIVYFSSIRSLKMISWTLIAAALLLRIYLGLSEVDPEVIYVFTLTRMDALIMGALVAVFISEHEEINYHIVKKILLGLALSTISLIYVFGPSSGKHLLVYTIGYTLTAMTFSMLILLTQSSNTFILRPIFRSSFLVFFGKYSYAIYIFHPLVRQFMLKIVGEPKVIFGLQTFWSIGFIILNISITVVVALISWNLFEKWFLKFKDKIIISNSGK